MDKRQFEKVKNLIKRRRRRNIIEKDYVVIPRENFELLEKITKKLHLSDQKNTMAIGTVLRETLHDTITPIATTELAMIRRKYYGQ